MAVFLKISPSNYPNSIFEKFYAVGHQFNKKLGGYMLAKFFEASLLGFMITLSLYIAGVEFSLILGLIAAATNIIPYVGLYLVRFQELSLFWRILGEQFILHCYVYLYCCERNRYCYYFPYFSIENC